METTNQDIFHESVNVLKKNNIYYRIKRIDINNRYGLLGLDKATIPFISSPEKYVYRIYVNRRDYDVAKVKVNEVYTYISK